MLQQTRCTGRRIWSFYFVNPGNKCLESRFEAENSEGTSGGQREPVEGRGIMGNLNQATAPFVSMLLLFIFKKCQCCEFCTYFLSGRGVWVTRVNGWCADLRVQTAHQSAKKLILWDIYWVVFFFFFFFFLRFAFFHCLIFISNKWLLFGWICLCWSEWWHHRCCCDSCEYINSWNKLPAVHLPPPSSAPTSRRFLRSWFDIKKICGNLSQK